jgi:hypothetical protein
MLLHPEHGNGMGNGMAKPCAYPLWWHYRVWRGLADVQRTAVRVHGCGWFEGRKAS